MFRLYGIALFVFFCFSYQTTCAQSRFEVQTRKVNVDNDNYEEIPYLIDLDNANNPICDTINSSILEAFMVESYEDSSWMNQIVGVGYFSEIKKNTLYISYGYTILAGFGPVLLEDSIYFDLNNGALLDFRIIPFHQVFKPLKYPEFMNDIYGPNLDRELATNKQYEECEEIDFSDLSRYWIDSYEFTDDSLSYVMDGNIHVSKYERGCAPFVFGSMDIQNIRSYLSDEGYNYLKGLEGLSKVDLYYYNLKYRKLLPENAFCFGDIGGARITMCLNVSRDKDTVTGFYYYNKYKSVIELNGHKKSDMIELTETTNKVHTGNIEIPALLEDLWFDNWWSLEKGTWYSANWDKEVEIGFYDSVGGD